MRVWVADDKPELVRDIVEYQKRVTEREDPEAALIGVDVLSITSRSELEMSVGTCVGAGDGYPDIIFLDLSFDSREDGLNALKFLKFHVVPSVRNIPVVMYSQSDSQSDIYVTISFRANAYMTKEGGLRRFWDAVTHWRSTQLAPHIVPPDFEDDLSGSYGLN